jgi:hypothetical protein
VVDAVFYNSLAETARRLIDEKGRDDLSFSRAVGTSYDPVTDTDTPGAALVQPVKCLVLPVTVSGDNTNKPGAVIDARKRLIKFAMDEVVFEPDAGDTIQFEDATWTVVGCTPVSPAGIPLAYTAVVERG